jgi:parallel beta-helix repeat protein
MFKKCMLYVSTITVALTAVAVATQTKTAVVGSCMAGVTGFPTILQAVNSVPSGGTVLVCPGTYPEQVTITVPLRLAGVTAAGSADAVITAPASLLANAVQANTGYSFPALVAVQNVSGVSINNMVIDGGTMSCSYAICAGIAYEGSSGTVQSSVVRNLTNASFLRTAIEADGSTLTVQCSSLHDVDFGISAGNSTVVLKRNTLSGTMSGILVGSTTSATISNNTLSHFLHVPLVLSAVSGASVLNNTVLAPADNAGILLQDSQSNTVAGNTVIGGFWGVSMLSDRPGGNSANVVQSNRFIQSSFGVGIDDGGFPGSSSIINNSILEAGCGISATLSIGDIITPNNFLGVVHTIC